MTAEDDFLEQEVEEGVEEAVETWSYDEAFEGFDQDQGAADQQEFAFEDNSLQATDFHGAEEEEDDDDEGVQEHLQDAMEGTLRLKRLLTSETVDEEGPASKKRKKLTDLEEQKPPGFIAKVQCLLTKWALADDTVVTHVLNARTEAELDMILASPWVPEKNHQWKSPAELVQNHVCYMKERQGVGGGPVDVVTAFKCRWKLSLEDEKKIRLLNHKDLRYVLKMYTTGQNVDELIEEAALTPPEEGEATGAVPEEPGLLAFGRYLRMELIDPLADAAVFGDANLTFALMLAKHRKGLGHVGRVIATTFEPLNILQQRYKEIDETIKILEDHFCEVYHEVDCTRIAVDPRMQGMEGSLGAVYYNFPHSGAVSGFFDGHPLVNWRHENLMRLFFRALRFFVKPGGVVKVASNAGAVGVRYWYIIDSATENEFEHIETAPFLEWHLHRYGRSYGDRRDVYKRPDQGGNYNAQRAEADMVYSFKYAPSGENLPKQRIRPPPSLKTLLGANEGPFKGLPLEFKKKTAVELYDRFVKECSGTHIG